ncbi:hypothetical protein SASPL_111938 [Salvia splendens]|uniref:Uncharacterized protein n=1 Tax=Salvia splendens TaxID=180675 RepID=A0A8X9A3S4_SALSN|nr:hypothetical protein SASPL_111938 [Salvia splendens]
MIMLNGTNYQLWRNMMKDLLFVKASHLPVFATKKPESKSDEGYDDVEDRASIADHVTPSGTVTLEIAKNGVLNDVVRRRSMERDELGVDNSASLHVTYKEFFTSYNLVTNHGTKFTLRDVIHSPDIRLNLISARKLDDERQTGKKLKCIRTDNGGDNVDLLMVSVIVPLQGDVPDKVWFSKEVSYDHLRVFGCKAFVHIPKDESSELDAKTRQ